jgi:hypothetical protein
MARLLSAGAWRRRWGRCSCVRSTRPVLYQRGRAAGPVPPPTDPAAEPPTRAQQQADALALLAETALHHELDPGAPGEQYQVVVPLHPLVRST